MVGGEVFDGRRGACGLAERAEHGDEERRGAEYAEQGAATNGAKL